MSIRVYVYKNIGGDYWEFWKAKKAGEEDILLCGPKIEKRVREIVRQMKENREKA